MVIGEKTLIRKPELTVISPGAQIGSGGSIHAFVWIGDVVIGNNVKIQPYAFIPTGVTIEDDCFIGPHVCFTNDKYPPSNGKGWTTTLVERGAVIGAGAVILPGITIGQKAVIGAGSLVTHSVPAGEIVKGGSVSK